MAKLTLGSTEKAYGDQKALDDLKTATKPLPISGAMAQKRGPGRPAGSKQASAAPTQSADVPPEHAELAAKAAIAQRAYMQLAAYAQSPEAGPWTRFYAELARSQFEHAALEARNQTPWFE